MEVLDAKLRHLTAASTAESFCSPASIGYTARQFMNKGTSAVRRLTSTLLSKFSTERQKNQTSLCESLYAENGDLKNMLYALANNPTTTSSLLDVISITSRVNVLESIAGNKSAPKETLRRLANHPDPRVRAAVTENRYAPFEVLAGLCEDDHPDVRFNMADNPNVPKSLLAKLANDDNPYVAARACTTLERLDGNAETALFQSPID